jgi:hypothetical protein
MSSSVNPFNVRGNDLGILTKAPENAGDPRVPLAEEFSSWAINLAMMYKDSNQSYGWLELPQFSTQGSLSITLSGIAKIPVFRGDIVLNNVAIIAPQLVNTSNTILANERLILVAMACEVGATQDPVLGQVSFQYRNPTNQQIVSIQKENSQRIRCFWGILRTTESILPNQFVESLTLSEDQKWVLTIGNKTSSGFAVGSYSFYALDPNWVTAKSYPVIPESVQFLPIGNLIRRQNITVRGYTWGFGGEESFDIDYVVAPVGRQLQLDLGLDSKIYSRIQEILSGVPGVGQTYLKTVQNLTAGSSAGVSGRPGESAGSPNGSVNLANSQRVSFTNQPIASNLSAETMTASNDGLGNAVCTFALNSSPSGTRFSDKRADHKIYNTNGLEISSRGQFSNLGSGGSLVWRAEDNPDISPGAMVFFQPTINYPAGSGFNFSFKSIEKVWLNTIEIPIQDILIAAETDLIQYTEPVGTQKKIVVFGPERAALHYIYSKVVVTSNAQGIAVIPSSEKGCFAFAQGKSGRIDAPIITGLTPNTNYNTLVYYPPRDTETWQVQFKYCQYQGLNNASLVNGAKIVSPPALVAHTQGGGASAFFGGSLRHIPIAMNLPLTANSPRGYDLNTPIIFTNEVLTEEVTMRLLLTPLSGAFVDPGQVGQTIETTAITGVSHPRSVSVKFSIAETDALLGCQAPPLKSGLPYQAVFIVCVEKNSNLYLIIATKNLSSGSLACDPSTGTAIDIFGI